MFLGSYQTSFSGKYRVILPKKFRSHLKGQEIVLTKGLEGCIWGFARSDFDKEAKKQLQIPIAQEQGRFLRRMLFAEAESSLLDRQGRFIIPASLLNFAQIGKEVLLVGTGDHFEIWNPLKWRRVMREASDES